uniref:Uncharacterized protein n=1 Tax=Chromera velia CCMP2878 TaxID=1169474 RepID=A0A0G4G811_9ALVE|eukprot:Cvel_20714.t1-p1 / transcript=Cvel_20714.t1 / gene=Cvel_20714 / organism=Chromera_velia_CCMP2878 / gene_product=hypothetical protein / transcript_product=hypothetical protein / location=Cvel_scaffold1885:27019-27813(-) / protein_length=128 / sequence_SO=supercontig / SO=protein_coding / is_pseudo=false
MEAKTAGIFGLTDDADIIKWVRQYADAVAILGGELYGGAPTEVKMKTEEETEAKPDISRYVAVPTSSEQRPASAEQVSSSSSSSSSGGGVQVVGVQPDPALLQKKKKQYKNLVAEISGLNADRGSDKV